jgi:hypothetical protein
MAARNRLANKCWNRLRIHYQIGIFYPPSARKKLGSDAADLREVAASVILVQ